MYYPNEEEAVSKDSTLPSRGALQRVDSLLNDHVKRFFAQCGVGMEMETLAT